MPASCTTFGAHQIVFSVSFVNVRCFNPDWLFAKIHATINYHFIGSGNYLIFFQIVFPNLYHAVTIVQLLTFIGRIVVNHISFSIFVEENGRIYTIKIQLYRVAPTCKRIFCFHNNIAKPTRKLRGYHIKSVVMFVVTNGWRINSGADSGIEHFQLRFSFEHMPYLFPVDQIFRMKNGYTRKHGKC